MRTHAITLALATALIAACGGSTPPPDASSPDVTTTDATPTTDAPSTTDATSPATAMESEPNNGSTTTEFNALALDTVMSGAIGTPGDTDIFRFAATAGRVYVVTLALPDGSMLQGHATVLDDGRDGHAAGGDYVKIAQTAGTGGPPNDARLEVLAMGTGGYLVAVRDRRNVGSAGGTAGGAGYTYTLTVSEHAPSEFVATASGADLAFPSTTHGELARQGSIRIYPFTATSGFSATFDLAQSGDMDGRLIAFSPATGSWAARNDDRSPSDTAPLISAPIEPAGPMLLVVENIDPAATGLGYTLTASSP